ncbi:MAG TPA: hypothetical protein VK154_15280 [Chitinophagales bacterium]|nr:hypothetical protein [Chitinophagales bacterium]
MTLSQQRIRSFIKMYSDIMSKKDKATGVQLYSHDYAIAKAARHHWYELSTAEQYLKVHWEVEQDEEE